MKKPNKEIRVRIHMKCWNTYKEYFDVSIGEAITTVKDKKDFWASLSGYESARYEPKWRKICIYDQLTLVIDEKKYTAQDNKIEFPKVEFYSAYKFPQLIKTLLDQIKNEGEKKELILLLTKHYIPMVKSHCEYWRREIPDLIKICQKNVEGSIEPAEALMKHRKRLKKWREGEKELTELEKLFHP